MSLSSVTLFDYEHQTETTQTFIYPFTFGSVGLPFTSKVGDVKVKAINYSIDILNDGNERIMNVFIKNFKDGKDLKVNLIIQHT